MKWYLFDPVKGSRQKRGSYSLERLPGRWLRLSRTGRALSQAVDRTAIREAQRVGLTARVGRRILCAFSCSRRRTEFRSGLRKTLWKVGCKLFDLHGAARFAR